MTAPRNITTQWTGGASTADVVLPTCAAGDLLTILVGGGNQVTAGPAGWTAYGALTGQEAQGRRFTKTADGSESGTTVTLTFDGGDQRYIVAVAVRDWDDHTLNFYEREGAVGTTYGAGTLSWDADQYQGDLLLTFTFCRNASQAPTMDRGVLWEEQTSGGSSAALYVESAPTYMVGEPFDLHLPERSGYVTYQMAVYGYTWTDWQAGDMFEYVQNQFLEEVNDTKYHADSETSPVGYPTITQDTFLDSQAAQVFSTADGVYPARWEHDRSNSIVGDPSWTRSWETQRRFLLYASQLTDAQLGVPGGVYELPPEGYETSEQDGESYAVGVYSAASVTDVAFDNTDGSSGTGLLSGSFSTVLKGATGVTWNTPGGATFTTGWDHTAGGAQVYVRPGQLTAGTSDIGVVDLSAALDQSARARVAVAAYVTGPAGSGEPAVNLRSYSFEGAAEFGASFGWKGVVEGGGLHWVIQPPAARFLVRRSPVVDIVPVPVPKLRLYPRDDVLGFSGVARQYPPPRRGRLYGQQP